MMITIMIKNFSPSDDPNRDGPIARNPNRTFEFNRTGSSNYIDPIKVPDKGLKQAIADYNKNKQSN